MAPVRRSYCAMLLVVAAPGLPALVCAPPAFAQNANATADSRLFVPMIDGDKKNVPRFRRPSYGNPPGSGAGKTGFDSTNVKANRKKPKPVVESEPLPPLAPPD